MAETSNSSFDLVRDHDAARLEHGIEADPPVAALDRRSALEADPGVAERVLRRAGELNGTEIFLVTPLMVRSPVIVQSSPSRVTSVDTKVMLG